jgi:hypothetical protein
MPTPDPSEPHRIEHNLVMLCEGKSDNEFFKKLLASRRLPDFSFPFPPEGDPRDLHGLGGYLPMLQRLESYLTFDPALKDRLKGILIVVDARDKPHETLREVRGQIRKAGHFGIPDAAFQIQGSDTGYPPIEILLMPGVDRPGALETLLVEALSQMYPTEAKCVHEYIKCCPTNPAAWGAEPADKARLQCLVAATYQINPSRPASLLFNRHDDHPPAIDIERPCFNEIEKHLRTFCRAVGAF